MSEVEWLADRRVELDERIKEFEEEIASKQRSVVAMKKKLEEYSARFYELADGERAGVAKMEKTELVAPLTERQKLEGKYGQVWDTTELQRDFEVRGFIAPYVDVVRKADKQRGTLEFQHMPRFYHSFEPTSKGR